MNNVYNCIVKIFRNIPYFNTKYICNKCYREQRIIKMRKKYFLKRFYFLTFKINGKNKLSDSYSHFNEPWLTNDFTKFRKDVIFSKKRCTPYITMFSSAERRHKSRLQRRLSALGHRSRLISFTLTRKKACASFVQALTRLISYLTLYARECHSDDYEDALQPIF